MHILERAAAALMLAVLTFRAVELHVAMWRCAERWTLENGGGVTFAFLSLIDIAIAYLWYLVAYYHA